MTTHSEVANQPDKRQTSEDEGRASLRYGHVIIEQQSDAPDRLRALRFC